ncbi:MAG: cell division protein FtsA, partial [Candidatus Magasanikbacteria bacterium]|nr:cell division protein FtsA [Candidatus Magasanikbacteria bacterium]
MVRMAVGQMIYRADESQAEMQILGAAEVPSEGMHKGSINSIEDLVSAVSSCLEKMERTVGVPIDRVWTGVSGLHIMSQNSKGVVAVSKSDSEISETDVDRALEAARSISTPLNYEVLHVLPKRFSVDGQTGIKDPVGMTGIRLEVDAQIILGASAQIKNLTKAIYRSGLEIEDLVLSILASSEAAVTNRQKDLGVAVVDFGASTTSLAVYEEGEILHSTILPIGSEHITNDIAIGLRTSIDVAERVKIEYGDCFSNTVSKKEEIDLYELGSGEHENIKRKYLSEIIEARVEEIMQKIDDELRKVGRSGMLPSGVVFTGGGAKLPGITEAAKKYLRLPATLGYPLNFISATD